MNWRYDGLMKISVIIPVYNAQKYLAACVTSIVHQTHRDLEIIIVDDGSWMVSSLWMPPDRLP